MEFAALAPYERALRANGSLAARTVDGRELLLDLARWTADADVDDETVFERCAGPVLDVGCGPGRLVAALLARGVPALGIDIARQAVVLSRARGSAALRRSVFDRLPGEGRWPTALLIDGNIGIGGDPARLLRRLRDVVTVGGHVLVETHVDEAADERLRARFTDGDEPVGPSFRWAHVGRPALARLAAQLDYSVEETWSSGGRTFVSLACGPRKPRTRESA